MTEFNGRLGHLSDIESPWGNAGGVVKTIEDVEMMAKTGVGWIEAGSYTHEPRLGNAWNSERNQFDNTVYYHNPENGETFNSLGMPNKGIDIVEKEIPEMVRIAHSFGKALLINIAPVSYEPARESAELVRRAYTAGADGVILNAGCPNVVTEDGGRHEILSRSPDALAEVLKGVKSEGVGAPVMVRISPQDTYDATWQIARVIHASKVVSAVFTPNTWPGHVPTDKKGRLVLEVPGGAGGKSGPAVSFEARRETAYAVRALRGSGIDIISSSGITNALELKSRLDLGAVAAAGTTFYYESQNGWQEDTARLLTDLAD